MVQTLGGFSPKNMPMLRNHHHKGLRMIDIRKGCWSKTLARVKNVDLIFTSPPYNVGSNAKRQDGRRKLGQFDPKSYGGITGYEDSLPQDEYERGQIAFLYRCEAMLADDGIVVYNHKPRRVKGRLVHPLSWISQVEQLQLMEEVIWDRGSTHNHSNKLLWPTTERLYVLKKVGAPYRFTNTRDMEFRSDVWRIPLTPKPANGHACPFTYRLASEAVRAFSEQGDLVCDPYSGSGTTALACKKLNRRFVGSEKNSKYYNDSIERVNNE